jgi:integrase
MQKGMELKKGEGSIIKLKQCNSPTGESKYWYILYYANGRQVRENSKCIEWKDAYDLLVSRRVEAKQGKQPASDVARIRYEDLRDSILKDYAANNTRFRGLLELNKFFKGMLASQITSDTIRDYIAWQLKEGKSEPTIRRHLVHLRAAFKLAVKEGKLFHAPYFPMPKDSEPAGQYLDPQGFAKLKAELPEDLRPLFTFLYYTSCRFGAASKITWDMVSKDADVVKIPGQNMKGRVPHTIVLAGKGLEPISAMLRTMFRRDGGRVFSTKNHTTAWSKACDIAGFGGYDKKKRTRTDGSLRIHDLRCSGAVNLIDAGVSEDIVMKIGGWKTKAMFSRYNVMNIERLRTAMIQGGDYVAQQMAR